MKGNMSQWRVNPSKVFILVSLIFIMLLIVVLPDVDLDDMAFRPGTAPLALQAKVTSAPLTIAVGGIFPLPSIGTVPIFRISEVIGATLAPNFRPILLRSLRR